MVIDATMEETRSLAYRFKQRLYYGTRRLLRALGLRAIAPTRAGAAVARRLRVRPRVTEDLAAWSHAHGFDCVVLSPAQTRARRAPIALDNALHPNFARHLAAQIAERFMVCLPQARVWGANGLVILPDGSFASQAIYDRRHLEADPAYSTPTPAHVVRKDGDYVTLLGEFSNTSNYYHWVHDGLLRLHGVHSHLPSNVKYLVPSPLYDHQRETLHLLGFRDEQLVPFTGSSVWECERLWFPSLPPSGAEVPDAVSWLRERFWAAAGVERAEPRRRFYLSRKGAEHARVVNEAELVPVLDTHGFEVIQPERMSVADQVRLFAQAEAIVSATSAGLTNLLFAGRETKNLEILEPEWAARKAFVVWTLAETLDQSFWYLTAETAPNPERPKRADLHVPAITLERALGRWLSPADEGP